MSTIILFYQEREVGVRILECKFCFWESTSSIKKKEKGYNDYFMKERTDIKEQNDMVTAFMCLDLRQEVV